jgi:site-specific DNA recombinase
MTEKDGNLGSPERVALRLRVSSEEQRERKSIEIQREFLQEYCRLYGLEVAQIYADDGVSGTIPLHERPEGRRLLEDAKEGKFSTLLVYRLDRLGRSLLVIVDAHDRLQACGVALKSATEPIDTSTASGRLIFQMLASFAEYDRGNIVERTQAGLKRAFKMGKHLGCIPFGYDVVNDGSLVVVEDEARIVRQIIGNIAGGATLYSEARRLNDEGVLSPGRKYRGQPRRHGTSWAHSTIRGIVTQGAYSGVHIVEAQDGPIEREVPAIVEPEVRERALSRLIENKRFSGGKKGHNYLLRGLPICEHCGTAYVGNASGRYHKYYACRKQRVTSDQRARELTCPRIRADWLEELVWTDVRGFLEHPGKILSRVRSQLEEDKVGEDLDERHKSLTRHLAAKQTEKDRYVKLYAQGLIDDEELEVHLSDLKNQVDNLRMLIASVETDLAQKRESKMVAESAEAWLLTLRKNLAEVERDTEEAFAARRELTNLLVERIVIGRDEEGRTKADITYRFGPLDVADGVRNSEEFRRAHGRGGAGGLLTGHPRMSSYSVAVERAPETFGPA